MKCPILIFIFVMACKPANAQEPKEKILHKYDFYFGMGLGSKSHFGNFGLTSNFLFTDNVSLKLSLGGGQFNYNGFLMSIGPELFLYNSKPLLLSVGATWTTCDKTADVLGDDDAPDHIWYDTSKMQYLRSFVGVCYGKESPFKFELGYSHRLTPVNYSFSNGRLPTTKEIKSIERGLNSGLLVSISVCFIINVRDMD